MTCYHCGKGNLYGRSHTHHRGVAGGRWKKRAPKTQRIFVANLQPVNIMENGDLKRVRLCAKCLKRIRKDVIDGVRPFLQLAEYQPREKEKKRAPVPAKVMMREGKTESVKEMGSAKENPAKKTLVKRKTVKKEEK